MANLRSTVVESTGTMKLPRGTTAERPASPASGMMRYNTTLQYTEIYNGSSWERFGLTVPMPMTAQVITSSGTHVVGSWEGYRTHTFFSGSHTFIPSTSGRVEVLVVAGGGSGGTGGGGGGAGGVIYNSAFEVAAGTSYSVSVGTGGAYVTTWGAAGNRGGNSVFGSLTAVGGGAGQHRANTNADGLGGSGGGNAGGGSAGNMNNATYRQGFPGGASITNGTTQEEPGGGGGGAGGAGQNSTIPASTSIADAQAARAGQGGPGLPFSISGTTQYYGGGGGGCNRNGVGALGGIGGGGMGGNSSSGTGADGPFNGLPNTGGGGGGTGYSGTGSIQQSGAGGSGIVIVRYATETVSPAVVKFKTTGTHYWKAPAGVTQVELLMIGGGGGGGGSTAGGGGAGGLMWNPSFSVIPGTEYTINIGAGGAGSVRDSVGAVTAASGSNTTMTTVPGYVSTAIGGGRGYSGKTSGTTLAATGGSGGGGGYYSGGASIAAGDIVGAAGTQGQGNKGGDGVATNWGGGGGGGAGGVGANQLNPTSERSGGIGLPFATGGAARYYAGGGGGGGHNYETPSPGGLGGGGYGGSGFPTKPRSGEENTGGGGGGGGFYQNGPGGGFGGSGVVTIKYARPTNLAGWLRPSGTNGGVLFDNNLSWLSQSLPSGTYNSVIWNEVFRGNFTLIARWSHDYIGAGFVYGPNVETSGFTGYSSDSSGPYFGAMGTSGFSNGYSGTFFGQYHAPITGSGATITPYFFKWQRSGNTLTLQYNQTGPGGLWTNFNSSSSVTINTGDRVICGIGEAGSNEYEPLRFVSLKYS